MKFKIEITKAINEVLKEIGVKNIKFGVEHPSNEKFGDYSSNVCLQSKKVATEKMLGFLKTKLKWAKKIEVAGGGFINIFVKDGELIKQIEQIKSDEFEGGTSWGKKVMVEYAHPNTHKQFHIGHLRNICLGESIANLLEAVGTKVIRVNYQGDVGLHIAKALWGIRADEKGYKLAKKSDVFERVKYLGDVYAAGSKAYEKGAQAKSEIIEFNNQIYKGSGEIVDLWKETRQWSLDYFDLIYKRVGTKYDRLYFESEGIDGVEIAKKAFKRGILSKSQGAVVFDGSKYGLHTRVFINSLGLPTYEAKELSLAPKEFSDFGKIDKCIHVVGPEQKSFFEVTFKVEELMDEDMFKGKQYHKVYEFVDLKKGKMSSREGQVVTGMEVLDEAKARVIKEHKSGEKLAEQIGVGAVKYGFLKVSSGSKILFDIEESVKLEGNSGPYLQYGLARTQSVLAKSKVKNPTASDFNVNTSFKLNNEEKIVLRSLYKFEEVIRQAAEELAPNLVCNYLYDLVQKYNSFYNKHKIVGNDFRLWLTESTGEVLKEGLGILGIETPEKM